MTVKLQRRHVQGIDPNIAAGLRALRINPSSEGGRGEIQNSNFFNIGFGSFTIYAEVIDLFNNGDFGYKIIDKKPSGSGYALSIGANKTWGFGFFNQGGAGLNIFDTRPLTIDGRPKSFCVTRQSTNSTESADLNNLRLYFNNQVVPPEFIGTTGNLIDIIFDNTASLALGGSNDSMRGYILKAYFYDRALSPMEVADLSSRIRRTAQGAKMLHELNQTSGSVAFDSSSASQHAQLINYADPSWLTLQGNRVFIKEGNILTFATSGNFAAPTNMTSFRPLQAERVKRLSTYGGMGQVEFSYNNSTWQPISFGADGFSTNFPESLISPGTSQTQLFFRASCSELSGQLAAIELHS